MNLEPPNRSTAVMAVLAALALVAMASGAATAAQNYDSETENTSATSDVSEGANIDFDPTGNSTFEVLVNTTYNTSNKKAIVEDNGSSYPNQSFTDGWNYLGSDVNPPTNHHFWSINISESDIRYIPHDADENKTVQIHTVNNTSVADANQSVITANVTLNTTHKEAVIYVASGDSELTLETESQFIRDDEKRAEVSSDGVGVNGDNSSVQIKVSNSSAQTRYNDNAVTGGIIGSGDDLSNETAIDQMMVTLDGTPRLGFMSSEDSDIVGSEDTYWVYDESNDVFTIEPGSNGFSDADTVDLAVSTDDLGLMERYDVASNYDAIGFGAVGMGFENVGGGS